MSSGAQRWQGGGRGGLSLVFALFVCLVAVVGVSCGEAVGTGGEDPTVGEVAPRIALSPRVAAVGSQIEATITGLSTSFDARTALTFGEGITVVAVDVSSRYELTAILAISAEALPGYRALTLTQRDGTELNLDDALLLQRGRLSLSPNTADRGQRIAVRLDVEGVPIEAGYTFADFGEGITPSGLTPIEGEAGAAWVNIVINSDAAPGPRDVSVQNGQARVVAPEGFTVGRGLVGISFDPGFVTQGVDALEYTITGYGTHFQAGQTAVNFGVGLYLDPEDPRGMIVESPTRITGRVKVCRAAVPGVHDVTVTTDRGLGLLEEVKSVGGIEVEAVEPSVEEAYGSFSLVYSRTWVEGRLQESVGASGVFQVVAGSCGSSNGSGCPTESAPPNQPTFYPPPGCTPVSNTNLFPPSPSIDAGPYVFIEGPGGEPSIRLDKEADSDGTFYYSPSEEIPLTAFIPNTAYSVRIPGGSGAGAVPETTLKDIIITPPALFSMTAPDLSYGPTLNPYDSVSVQWETDEGEAGAQTFPLANLSLRMQSTGVTDGITRRLDVRQIIPDSGSLDLRAEDVSFLPPGVGRLSMTAARQGPVYSLPGSRYSTLSSSAVVVSGAFELRE